MPTFLYPWLAIAGAVAAAVPVVVHLLNRRRFRVVQWAAMDFLREAVTQSRRVMELRDLWLLLVRVLCLLFFGLALARPFWSRFALAAVDPNQPVHAVMLIDNSLSMSYATVEGTLLDEAKTKTKRLIEDLPRGSLISVLPTCGSAVGFRYEAYARPADAIEALAAIKPVDRAARAGPVIDLALEACRRTGSMAARRIFLVTDQQVAGWSAEAESEHLRQLPCPMQVVQVAADEIENAWVADVQLRDGVADAQSPAVFIAKIGYQGHGPRNGVQVTLKVDGAVIATQTVSLEPGQLREVQFPEYHFSKPADAGRTSYVAAEVSIPHDRLPGDDQRSLVVPVTASLPVVFVDQYGADEAPQRNRYGETFWLRQWLAGSGKRSQDKPSLIQVRHLKIDQLNRSVLADARLVVIAGVASPPPASVALLSQYIEQGGNLLLAAGGGFNPAAWSDVAWKDGQGLLPTPLGSATVGRLPEEAGELAFFLLNFDSLVHQYFWPEGVDETELRGMLGPPLFFFKAVAAQCNATVQEQSAKAANDYFGPRRKQLDEIDRKLTALDAPAWGDAARVQQNREDLLRQREEIQPAWLGWRKQALGSDEDQLPLEELARRARPVVLGQYNNGLPLLVRRYWGRGQVVLLTTSLSSQWNTISKCPQAIWLVDRMVRGLLAETLPSRNLSSESSLVLPIAAAERSARFTLTDAEGQQQSLAVDALSGDRYGLSLGNWTRRGVYRLTASRSSESSNGNGSSGSDETKLWEIPLAVNGPADESELDVNAASPTNAARQSFAEATAQAYSVAPIELQGIGIWKWLIGLVLLLLLVELLLAARFVPRVEASR